MLDKIMYTIANILMVVEAAAVIFLVWAWRDEKRKQREAVLDNPPFARQLMPMGAVTYAIACSHCKNRGPKGNDKAAADRCHRCRCEIESGFEVDPANFMGWISVTERLPEIYRPVLIKYLSAQDGTESPNFVDTAVMMPGDVWYWWEGDVGDCDISVACTITHWMPLPEPPKEVEW